MRTGSASGQTDPTASGSWPEPDPDLEAVSSRSARPLLRPAPRSAMFFPMVVLVAVLPGLHALKWWDLTPPGPWWGLRALAVLEGQVLDQVPASASLVPRVEAPGFRRLTMQPPLYAWLAALSLRISPDRTPMASVWPSYAAGVLVVILVYLHGRLWWGPGLGLVAALLTGFNRHLLSQMQQASPTTLALAGVLAALWAYGQHLCSGRVGRSAWAVVGGLALGLSLLALGGFGLLALPVVLLHQAYLGLETPPTERPRRGWHAWRSHASLTAGGLVVALAAVVAGPWYLRMFVTYGGEWIEALSAPSVWQGTARLDLASRLVALAPMSVPLGLYAVGRTIRRSITTPSDDGSVIGGVFWVVWLGVAALMPALWPAGPRAAQNLFLLVPLNLLAALAIVELANRRIAIKSLILLAPATAAALAWWTSANLRDAVASLLRGQTDAATALGLHLGLDLLGVLALTTWGLTRWARLRDDRQRLILAGFLLAVAGVTVGIGLREVRFRHRETRDLLALHDVIVRRHQADPFDYLVIVGPSPPADDAAGPPPDPAPGGRLRFILHSAAPGVPQYDLTRLDDLLALPEGRRLVILAGTRQRLPYALQTELGLEAIHPGTSGVLDAFATVRTTPRLPP